MRQQKGWIIIALMMTLSACVSIPEPLQGEYPVNLPAQSNIGQVGSNVRWGGNIIATNPEAHQTCIEILGKQLDDVSRPVEQEESQGRFIACKSGFQDPEVFKAGREITITGRLERLEPRNIGEYEYRYPIVSADVIYLWPERSDYRDRAYPYTPYYWYRPYPYFLSPYPYFGRGVGFYGYGRKRPY
jgi:outer membrane lipoprotein